MGLFHNLENLFMPVYYRIQSGCDSFRWQTLDLRRALNYLLPACIVAVKLFLLQISVPQIKNKNINEDKVMIRA